MTIEAADWASRRSDLLAVRYAVFVEEQGVPAALEQDAHDPAALHLLALTAKGEPVGTARLLPDGHIGRMAVLRAWRGQGIGGALLQRLVGIAGRLGHRRLVLHAQCHAEAFYRRFGFVADGAVFEEAGIDHRRMCLHIGDDAS